MLIRLLNNLPAYYNKESKREALFLISPCDCVNLDFNTATLNIITGSRTVGVSLSGKTVAQVIAAVTAAGFTANKLTSEYDSLHWFTIVPGLAVNLRNQETSFVEGLRYLTTDNTEVLVTDSEETLISELVEFPDTTSLVCYEQSTLRRLLGAVGWFMLENQNCYLSGLKEAYFNQADTEWLELFGRYFGQDHSAGETDTQYFSRIVAEVTKPRCNNFALRNIIQSALGYVMDIVDTSAGTFGVYFASRFSTLTAAEITTLKSLIAKYKSLGTGPTYYEPTYSFITNDTNSLSNNSVMKIGPKASTWSLVTI